MSAVSIQIPAATVVDPNAAAPVNVQATGPGSVSVDPNAPAPAGAKKDERPQWLPEKFKTPEDLAKAYSELEKKQGQAPKPADTPAPTTDQAAQVAQKAGLDLQALSKEYQENNGKLTEASLKKLETAGLSREQVASYIAGQQALASQLGSALTEMAGGEDVMKAVLKWAETNLSKEEIAAYNSALDTNNVAASRLAMGGVLARYQSAVGRDGQFVNTEGAPGSQSGAQPFTSRTQITTAMRDPRYESDPAYRKEVERRVYATDYNTLG